MIVSRELPDQKETNQNKNEGHPLCAGVLVDHPAQSHDLKLSAVSAVCLKLIHDHPCATRYEFIVARKMIWMWHRAVESLHTELDFLLDDSFDLGFDHLKVSDLMVRYLFAMVSWQYFPISR
ncbi:hypothetical protein BPA30113_00150 [Burkholderia paludis]|uniref:Uncharacterized protein n=1 Tax=Burkholderia paludis TaxID=1506587 RepID=A0A6J5DC93_9BURK|nr:hypothetical protein LMG30113_01328 [Burkholderia paludis]VWB09689.1 hypothetical protein BPA30113_00150 [Burkholderia paludis]